MLRARGKLRARLWPTASERRPKAPGKRTKQGDKVATVVQNVNLRLPVRGHEQWGSAVGKGPPWSQHRPNVEAFPAPHQTHTRRVCSLRTRAQDRGAARGREAGSTPTPASRRQPPASGLGCRSGVSPEFARQSRPLVLGPLAGFAERCLVSNVGAIRPRNLQPPAHPPPP